MVKLNEITRFCEEKVNKKIMYDKDGNIKQIKSP